MTRAQKLAVLRELRVTANLNFACAAAGVTREDAWAARDSDRLFERDWRAAVDAARQESIQRRLYPATHD